MKLEVKSLSIKVKYDTIVNIKLEKEKEND